LNNLRLRALVAMVLLSITFHAYSQLEKLKLTLSPLSNPSIHVAVNEVGSIYYELVNHSKETHTLSMRLIEGVVQETDGKKFCKNPITLKPGKSCVLSLKVTGKQAIGLEMKGPKLCELEHPGLSDETCIQPTKQERISIVEPSQDEATLSVMIKKPFYNQEGQQIAKRCYASPRRSAGPTGQCTLVLFQNTDTWGAITVTNTSNTTANFVQAYGVPSDIYQDATTCVHLKGKGTCTIWFYPSNNKHSQLSLMIRGANTGKSIYYVSIEELGVGDTYDRTSTGLGGILFQLPSSGNNYTFYTVLPTDESPSPHTWPDAYNLCPGNYSILPPAPQLVQLYKSSNCQGGPISNFNCSGVYWGDQVNSTMASSLNFATGILQKQPQTNLALGRCVIPYTLSNVGT
jgi:hypothetical protein